MARYTEAVCKLCRREGKKLFLKGDKCYSEKCPFVRRAYAPGMHGQRRTKLTRYGTQLREKQTMKRIYGVLEKQFRIYFERASKQRGVTAEILVKMVESRLDNVVYRMGFALSRSQARQLVRHGHFNVNGKKVSIPSYQVKSNDIIEIRENKRNSPIFKEILEIGKERQIPSWIEVDFDKFSGKFDHAPASEEVNLPINIRHVVELYSK
ncbi:MAG: 30S ribosomal protein S4 [Thermotoga sp.]|nr:30S ribosomal protein S4 [Thermotogota bacterium]RKX54178.1 MAG: 30S ribosomal protein S4 [Thermotoga sp.]